VQARKRQPVINLDTHDESAFVSDVSDPVGNPASSELPKRRNFSHDVLLLVLTQKLGLASQRTLGRRCIGYRDLLACAMLLSPPLPPLSLSLSLRITYAYNFYGFIFTIIFTTCAKENISLHRFAFIARAVRVSSDISGSSTRRRNFLSRIILSAKRFSVFLAERVTFVFRGSSFSFL